jgi:hypothetical protein
LPDRMSWLHAPLQCMDYLTMLLGEWRCYFSSHLS